MEDFKKWLAECSFETMQDLFEELDNSEIAFKENTVYQKALEAYKKMCNDNFGIVNMPILVYKEMARRYCFGVE